MEIQLQTENTNPVLEKEKKKEGKPMYNEDEVNYAGYLQRRLMDAKNQRDRTHDEFDGMTYLSYYENNLKLANSHIPPKANKEDVLFVTGTTRQGLLALCAKINQLNLSAEVKAFDKDNRQQVKVGLGMEAIMTKTKQLDMNEEKRALREYELYTQGTAFNEIMWTEEFQLEKNLNTSFKDYKGQVEGIDWTSRLKKCYEGVRCNLLPGPNVYLGNIREYFVHNQPYVFSYDKMNYDEAKAIYGKWERWDYVRKDGSKFTRDTETSMMYYNNWTLREIENNEIEILKYQDEQNNEFMIILNGVMMMPIGFPIPWKSGKYNITKDVYEIISPYFAYGGSMPKRLKSSQALENEFWRLALLKTQKSFFPAYANMTGKVLSQRIFMPGKITNNLNADQLKVIGGDKMAEGVTTSEINMIKMLRENNNENSLPEISKGQQPTGDPTATEVVQIQREARVLLGLAIFGAALMEKKVSEVWLDTLLENWFDPEGTVLDEAREMIVDKYRSASVSAPIEGEGRGRRMVELDPELNSDYNPRDIYNEEEKLSKEESQPVRKIVLNPTELKKADYIWYIEVFPKEKESSELQKVLFDGMVQRIMQFPNANMEWIEEEFAKVWNIPADKAFTKNAMGSLNQPIPPDMMGGVMVNPMGGNAATKIPQKPSINTLANA